MSTVHGCESRGGTSGRRSAPPPRRSARRPRRGITSVLAMLYLVLFATLAIGFYAGTTMSAQVSRNEKNIVDAQFAAEGGLQFMRYYLGSMDITTTTPNANLLPSVASELGRLLNGQSNMGGNTVQITGGTTIYIPAAGSTISLDSTGRQQFRATVTQSGAFLILTVVGLGPDASVTRTLQMKYQKAPRASAIFDYGVASNGKIVTAGSSIIIGQGDPARGSVLSTNMTDPTPVVIGGKQVSGDISIVNPAGNVSYSGASVGGTSDPAQIAANHVHKGVQKPDFPDIDTSEYSKYATTAYDGKSNTLDNVYIPAGTNPKFTGNTTITGVLYVKAPNKVSFGGNVSIQGLIVVENNVAMDLAKNQLNFTGSVTAQGVETLPDSYGGLKQLTGAFILAPGYAVDFGGNFGTVGGHIIASNINFSGNAGGVVKGSIINLANVEMDVNGSSDVIIASTGTSNYPTGVTFGIKYVPLPDTYVELP